jgi:3-dehydroquinate synthase
MKRIDVSASRSYPIFIGQGLLKNPSSFLNPVVGDSKLAILTDDHVDPLYGEKLMANLQADGHEVVKMVIPAGENSKSPEQLFAFLNFLAENHLTRSDRVIALGGGVVGDLAGFAASIYLRGIRFIQIPTTLLAAVDSSVGGKTAIDIPAGKNQVGTFWQPDLVLCDTDTLRTLPPDIFRDGCAEVIKYGAIWDRELFDNCKKPLEGQIEEIIARCVEIKRDIVEKDERDTGLRGLLNFGHTLGHGIEKYSHFEISHGSAVAIGMILASRLAATLGICEEDCVQELFQLISAYRFDTKCPFTAEQLFEAALSDKKRSGSRLTLVLPKQIGQCILYPMALDQLLPLLKKIL